MRIEFFSSSFFPIDHKEVGITVVPSKIVISDFACKEEGDFFKAISDDNNFYFESRMCKERELNERSLNSTTYQIKMSEDNTNSFSRLIKALCRHKEKDEATITIERDVEGWWWRRLHNRYNNEWISFTKYLPRLGENKYADIKDFIKTQYYKSWRDALIANLPHLKEQFAREEEKIKNETHREQFDFAIKDKVLCDKLLSFYQSHPNLPQENVQYIKQKSDENAKDSPLPTRASRDIFGSISGQDNYAKAEDVVNFKKLIFS